MHDSLDEGHAYRSRTPMSSATIKHFVTTGSINTCSQRSVRSGIMQRAGSGPTITRGRTWPWKASPQNRSWPVGP